MGDSGERYTADRSDKVPRQGIPKGWDAPALTTHQSAGCSRRWCRAALPHPLTYSTFQHAPTNTHLLDHIRVQDAVDADTGLPSSLPSHLASHIAQQNQPLTCLTTSECRMQSMLIQGWPFLSTSCRGRPQLRGKRSASMSESAPAPSRFSSAFWTCRVTGKRTFSLSTCAANCLIA